MIGDKLLIMYVDEPLVKLDPRIGLLVVGTLQHDKIHQILFAIELGIVQAYHAPIQP